MKTQLGKIQKASYGACGYQEAMLGLRITIGGKGWGVVADKPGSWSGKRSSSTQWTEADRIRQLGENAMEINQLLTDAKVDCVEKLIGIPVECTFEGNMLKSWRILKEVL